MKKYIAVIFFIFFPSLVQANDNDVATRIINNHTFKVPNDYLWQGKNKWDGDSGGSIYMLAEWPNMNPIPAFDDGINIVKVTIENRPTQITIKLKDGTKIPKYLNNYYTSAGMLKHNNDHKEIIGEPIYIGTFKKLNNLSYYKLPAKDNPTTISKDYFIRGDPLRPDYWIRCQQLGCSSSFQYNDDIVVNYYFERRHFVGTGKLDDLRNKVTEFVSKFNLKE